MHTLLGVYVKFWYPPLESLLKSGYHPLIGPPGYRKLFRAAGANRAKGASGAAGELCERGMLLCSFSFFVCVKNGYLPSPSEFSVKVWHPPSESLSKMVTLPQGAGSFSWQQGRTARKERPGRRRYCAKGVFCCVLFLFLCV